VAATLDFKARVEIASRLDLDSVPLRVSVWGDVEDDLAVVATLTGESRKGAEHLALAAQKLRDKVVKSPTTIGRFLRTVLKGVKVSTSHNTARVVLLIGPQRLHRVVKLLMKEIGVAS
jgi:hypothetical protein